MNQETMARHVAGRALTAPPAPARSLGLLVSLGVRELTLSKKTLVVALLGALLLSATLAHALALVFGFVRHPNIPLVFGFLVTEAFLRFFLPVVSLFYGAALVTDEVDGRTLTYLTTRPIDKRLILWGKFGAFALVASIIQLVTLLLCWVVLAGSQGPAGLIAHLHLLFKDAIVTVLGVLSYGALFTFLGAILRKPVIPGLIFTFVWEQFASFLPGSAQRLTILHFLQSLTPHVLSPSDDIPFLSSLFTRESPMVAVPVLLVITGVFLYLAGTVFRDREYRLEK